MNEIRKINRDKKMPTFVIELWRAEKYLEDWEDLPDHILKRMFAGKIEHIQSGDSQFFNQASKLLKFIEDRRTKLG